MPQTSTPKRLLSLDALRGFDMFWITGGEEIVHVLAKITGWGWAVVVATQFTHVEWNGFRAYDLIFPTFLFLSGVSTPFAMGSRLAQGAGKNALMRKVVQRGLTLVVLGVIYNNGLQIKPLSEMRFASVLGRIGLAGMFAQLIYIYFSSRQQYAWFAGLLLGFWAAMMLIPVPGCGAGVLTMECNLASYVDRLILPGRFHRVIHDPEGIFSTLPAIGTGLLGIFSGNILKDKTKTGSQKTGYLLALGLTCLLVGWAWDVVFPINKNLWTSSFVLFAGGWSVLLLAIFYWIVDVLNWQRWTFPFVLIGTNSILIYMAHVFIDFEYSANALFSGIWKYFPEPWQSFSLAVGFVLVELLLLYFLYKKKVFLKV
jgi:predicted acyltransferase